MAKKPEINNPTGLPELDAALAALTGEFGVDMSGDNYGNIVTHTTGSLSIDVWLKRGGFPTGRIIEIIGANKTMKTSLVLLAIAARQRWRKANGIVKKDLVVDLECSLEEGHFTMYGVDMNEIIWKRVDNIEQGLEMCRVLGRTGAIDYVLFDSIDAGQNEKQQRRRVGENDVGGTSKDMNFAMRDLTKIAPKTGTTFFFINQIKLNPGVMYGSPETTPGGLAAGFYASLRIKMLPRKECPDIPGATLIGLRGVKTRMASDVDWDDLWVAVVPGVGFDEVYELNQLATQWEIMRHSAGQTKVRWQKDVEMVALHPLVDKGKQAALDWLRTHEPTRFRLKQAVLRAGGIPGALSDTEVLAMYPGEFDGEASSSSAEAPAEAAEAQAA